MTRRLLNLLTLCLAAVLGCDRPEGKSTRTPAPAATQRAGASNQDLGPWDRPPPPPVAQPLRPDDLAVFDAALTHFADDPEVNKWSRGGKVIVVPRTGSGGWLFRGEQLRFVLREGNIPEDVLNDLELRNNGALVDSTPHEQYVAATRARQGTSIATFRPTHLDVVMMDAKAIPRSATTRADLIDALRTAHPNRRTAATLWLPGYSTDGRRAAVLVGYEFDSVAAYVLEKDSRGAWNVLWRERMSFVHGL